VANDIETAAVKNIRRNVEFNGINDAQIIPNQGDARWAGDWTTRNRFVVVCVC
jgi:tRNA G26 N,N-dimethylase Trm1